MNSYKFQNLPITPIIIESLIIELFNGQLLKRKEIVNKILDHHINNGGLKPEAVDFPRSVKKALERLEKKSYAINRSYSFWEIIKSDADIVEVSHSQAKEQSLPKYKCYGKGNTSAVYLYYYPQNKELAELKGKSSWPCKIGQTSADPLSRIVSQSSTALSEKPVIEFVIFTDQHLLLEKMLHSIFKLQNKVSHESPGSEWFDINPNEVLEIINYINKDIL